MVSSVASDPASVDQKLYFASSRGAHICSRACLGGAAQTGG